MRFGIHFLLIVVMGAATTCADEPVRPRGPLKQRVSPKLLREAMAVPEYRARMAVQNPVSLTELQTLADKLKQNGDTDGANLLQRFIHEHEQLTRQSAALSNSSIGKLVLNCHIFESRLDDIPHDSALVSGVTSPLAIHQELDKLVASGKAKLILDPRLIESKSNVPVRCFSDGEFPIALHNGKSAKIEIRDCHSTIEILPTIIENQRIKMQLKLVSGNEAAPAASSLTPTKSDALRCEPFCLQEIHFGEALVHSLPHPKQGYGLFVVVEATPRF